MCDERDDVILRPENFTQRKDKTVMAKPEIIVTLSNDKKKASKLS